MDSNHVYRTVYVDHDVDAALRAQAAREDVPKGEMCRRYLAAGMRRLNAGKLQIPAADNVRLSMRSVYLPAGLDEEVQGWAWKLKAAKTHVMRHALRAGMEVVQGRA